VIGCKKVPKDTSVAMLPGLSRMATRAYVKDAWSALLCYPYRVHSRLGPHFQTNQAGRRRGSVSDGEDLGTSKMQGPAIWEKMALRYKATEDRNEYGCSENGAPTWE
jgi:hypothetical protein